VAQEADEHGTAAMVLQPYHPAVQRRELEPRSLRADPGRFTVDGHGGERSGVAAEPAVARPEAAEWSRERHDAHQSGGGASEVLVGRDEIGVQRGVPVSDDRQLAELVDRAIGGVPVDPASQQPASYNRQHLGLRLTWM